MITFTRQKYNFSFFEKWFADSPTLTDSIKFIQYIQCSDLKRHILFKRTPFITKIISLDQTHDQILKNFEKNVAYEIRRAKRDGIATSETNDELNFVKFYNKFATRKGLPAISIDQLKQRSGNLKMFQASFNDSVIVMNAYILDETISRVRLLYSASHFRDINEKSFAAIVGRANRLLHWHAISFFKENKYLIYDLGGYALGTKDKSLININKFKDGFGGELLIESKYCSYPFLFLRVLVQLKKFIFNS